MMTVYFTIDYRTIELTFSESGDEVCLTIEQVVMADCDEINLVEALFKWYLILRFGFSIIMKFYWNQLGTHF